MKVRIENSLLKGKISVPSSKSIGHRAFIASFLSCKKNTVFFKGISQDTISTLQCLIKLGCVFKMMGDRIEFIDTRLPIGHRFHVRESASTIRFLLPLTTYYFKEVVFITAGHLINRPLSEYEKYYSVTKDYLNNEIHVKSLSKRINEFEINGDESSQFITGLLFYLTKKRCGKVKVLGEIKSRPYVDLTLDVLNDYGVEIEEKDNEFIIKDVNFKSEDFYVEGDWSLAANYIVYNRLINEERIFIDNLKIDSIQGDSIISSLLDDIDNGKTISLKHTPDLGPILFVYAAVKNNETTFIDFERLRIKESNRIESMEELNKAGITFDYVDNKLIVKGKKEHKGDYTFYAHNDHRIAMALSMYSLINNGTCEIVDAECVKKSYVEFFNDLIKLGANIQIDLFVE